MKLYGRTFFLLTYFFLINNILGNAQNVGYVRIIDNSDKSNDYKDCLYNRFDDILINNMTRKGINIVDYNKKVFSEIIKSYDKNIEKSVLGNGYIDRNITSNLKEKIFNKLKNKKNLDYLLLFENEKDESLLIERLKCGTDLIIDNWNGYPLKFVIIDLGNYSKNNLIFKLNKNKYNGNAWDNYIDNINLSQENFDEKTNVNNFIKDILDITKKSELNNKTNTEKSELNSGYVKTNNNSIPSIRSFSNPRIMVLPKKIDEKNYNNGEYFLKKEEKMIIASLKKVLEDNNLKTIGFESVIKNLSERRLLQSGTKVDLKTLILESNEADFYVEFEDLGSNEKIPVTSKNQSTFQSNENQNYGTSWVSPDELTNQNRETSNKNYGNCPQSFDFKIRNYATGEDIASDLQEINTCGSVEEYKKFANKILNNGAISKIKDEFQYLIQNGKKISVFFSFSDSSNRKFDDKIQGLRISQHIEKFIKENSFNGNFILSGVVNNYMSFPQVAIPFIDKNNGQTYTASQFSNLIRDYLENYLEIKEVTVTGSSINFILN